MRKVSESRRRLLGVVSSACCAVSSVGLAGAAPAADEEADRRLVLSRGTPRETRVAPTWSAPIRMASDSCCPELASAGRRAVLAWSRFDGGAVVRRSGVSGSWQPRDVFPASSGKVAASPRGRAAFAWFALRRDGVKVVRVATTGRETVWRRSRDYLAERPISPGDDLDEFIRSVAINDAGAAAVAWITSPDEHAGPSPTPSVLHVAFRPAGEAWGNAFSVFRTQMRLPRTSSLAITPRGRVLIAYRIGRKVFVRTRLPQRGWTDPVRVAAGQRRAIDGSPELAVAPSGRRAVVMWRTPPTGALRLAHYEQGRWGTPQQLTRGVVQGSWDVSLSRASAPFVGWISENGDVVTARWTPSTGTINHRTVLAQTGVRPSGLGLDLASSPEGDTAMAWAQPRDRATEFLDVAYRPRSGGWSTPHRVDGRAQHFIKFALGVRSDGRADLVWEREIGPRLLYTGLSP
jgi:hypothetical protein